MKCEGQMKKVFVNASWNIHTVRQLLPGNQIKEVKGANQS